MTNKIGLFIASKRTACLFGRPFCYFFFRFACFSASAAA
jgi:hypothetical protein